MDEEIKNKTNKQKAGSFVLQMHLNSKTGKSENNEKIRRFYSYCFEKSKNHLKKAARINQFNK